MRLVPYEPWHARMIELQPAQEYMRDILTEDDIQSRPLFGPCYTVMDGPLVICCAGICNFWPGRGMIWSFISKHVTPSRLVIMHRMVTEVLRGDVPARLEFVVDSDFPAAHRWAKMLGFKHESHMPKWGYEGRDADQYVRFS